MKGLKTLFNYLDRFGGRNKEKRTELVGKIATAMQRPEYLCITPNIPWLNKKSVAQLEQMLATENAGRIKLGLEPIL